MGSLSNMLKNAQDGRTRAQAPQYNTNNTNDNSSVEFVQAERVTVQEPLNNTKRANYSLRNSVPQQNINNRSMGKASYSSDIHRSVSNRNDRYSGQTYPSNYPRGSYNPVTVRNNCEVGFINSQTEIVKELNEQEKREYGINNLNQKAVLLGYKTLEVPPLEVPIVNDTNGSVSDRIDYIAHQLQLSVIPVECLKFPYRLNELQRYTISEFDHTLVVSGKEDFVSKERVEDFIDMCYRELTNLNEIRPRLDCIITVEGRRYHVPRFNEHELQYICGRLSNFCPRILLIGDSEQRLLFDVSSNNNYYEPAMLEELDDSGYRY